MTDLYKKGAAVASDTVETLNFEPIKGYPMLNWRGKRPFTSTHFYPAQLKEQHGSEIDGWLNKIYWGDNLQVMSHMLKNYRGKVDLIYIDPPFDSKADYKKKIQLRGASASSDGSAFEEKQYTDIWTNDEFLQFIYERLILCKECLSDTGSIFLHTGVDKSPYMRLLFDEVFGMSHFRNEIIWSYQSGGRAQKFYSQKHDVLWWYSKSDEWKFNIDAVSTTRGPMKKNNMKRGEENGRVFYSIKANGKEYRYYEDDLVPPTDVWEISHLQQQDPERLGYPTQKPEKLLKRVIAGCSDPGDLVFDCFMGSATTQAVAMKLGRRFLGADINLGAIQTATKRLINAANYISNPVEPNKTTSLPLDDLNDSETLGEVEKSDDTDIFYTGFEVYNVNNYDIFRNPIEAKDLLIEALELQKLQAGHLFDGERDGRLWKIMPVNKIATRQDLNEIIAGLNLRALADRLGQTPNQPAEKITLVCMGHEPDLAATLNQEVALSLNVKAGTKTPLDVQVLDILRDRDDLQFKRDSEAKVGIVKGQLVIEAFYPMNLLSKLSLQKEKIGDWREMVDSIMVDFNYDGAVFNPALVDIPEKNALVAGTYHVPTDAGTIRVKITDILSESLELEVRG